MGSRNLVSGRVEGCVFIMYGVQNGCDAMSDVFFSCCCCFLYSSFCVSSQTVVFVQAFGLFLGILKRKQRGSPYCRFLGFYNVFCVGVVALHACVALLLNCVAPPRFSIPCLGASMGLLIPD